MQADRLMFDALSRGDYGFWRKRSLKDMEQAGQHEMLNWMALIGAMEALDRQARGARLRGDAPLHVGEMLRFISRAELTHPARASG